MAAMPLERRLYSVTEVRRLARRVLPRPVFDFADGGAEDERTLRRNEAAFGDIELLPRPLNGAADARSLGRTVRPAPGAAGDDRADRAVRPVLAGRRDRGGARRGGRRHRLLPQPCLDLHDWRRSPPPARAALDAGLHLSATAASPANSPSAPQAAGYDALVLTIDNQMLGNRERDIRNGFTIPPRFGAAATLAGMATQAPWLLRMRTELPRHHLRATMSAPGEAPTSARWPAAWRACSIPAMSWARRRLAARDVDGSAAAQGRPASRTRPPRRSAHGIDGIIVSNHGGRQLDGAAASHRRAARRSWPRSAGAFPVLVDGGIRRGADVVKALALGAAACLIGRPQLWGLAVAGEAGVATCSKSTAARSTASWGWAAGTISPPIDRSAIDGG